MNRSKNKTNTKFDEKYFKGYFKRAVGGFTGKDLQISRNWFWMWLEKINNHLPRQSNGLKVLEIGCSIGGVANLLAERGYKVWGSDISEYAVLNAAKLTKNAQFLLIDIRKKIPLAIKFDYIIAFEVVEHLPEPIIAIKNIYHSLKSGGKIILSSPYPYLWNMKDPTHINVKFPHEWINILRQAGFHNIQIERFTLLPFFYRFHHRLQIALPHILPLPFINSPLIFIGEK